MPGDNVDYPVDRIGAPQGRAGPADDLDALHVFQHSVLCLPVDTGEGGIIDAAAIDEHQELVGKAAVETSGSDRPLVRIDARHVKTRHHTQGVGNIRDTGTPQIVAGDHEYGSRSLGERLRFLGYRGDLDMHQFFEAELQYFLLSRWRRRRLLIGPAGDATEQKANGQIEPMCPQNTDQAKQSHFILLFLT